LRKSNSLIGTALRLLTEDSSNQEALKTSLGTLIRVLDAVDWHTISKDKPEAWLRRRKREAQENAQEVAELRGLRGQVRHMGRMARRFRA
jgi:hypothetical protein